jgi:hypothetical protein
MKKVYESFRVAAFLVVAGYHRAQPITFGEADRGGDVTPSNVVDENGLF